MMGANPINRDAYTQSSLNHICVYHSNLRPPFAPLSVPRIMPVKKVHDALALRFIISASRGPGPPKVLQVERQE